MSVFAAYSAYYDLLYADKDYASEAEYVARVIERYRPGSVHILDLGCGTGRHDSLLAAMNHRVTGVDVSEDMLRVARASARDGAAEFVHGDVRAVRLGKTFDIVVSLFHVMSYQTTNDDLVAAFATAREHLAPGGVFLFDCWYGPAVLTDRPTTRIKRLEDERIAVTRLAEPVMHPNENLVDVNYQVLIRDKRTNAVEELREKHSMRYLFAPEVGALLQRAGLRLLDSREFLTDRNPGFDTWTVMFAASRSS